MDDIEVSETDSTIEAYEFWTGDKKTGRAGQGYTRYRSGDSFYEPRVV